MIEITVDDLKTMIDSKEDIFILDVRQPGEVMYGKINNDVLIPMHEIQSKLETIPKDKKVIVYCRSGNRSHHVAVFLRKHNIDAYNLEGGILAWKKYDPEVIEY